MARAASTYRAARRNAARRARLDWRTGRVTVRATQGGFALAAHASMPQRYGVPAKAATA